MRLVRLFACSLTLAVLVPTAQAGFGPPAHPSGLRPFLLRISEPSARSFARTPSFAWQPVRNAAFYEFELATSPAFNDGSMIWASDKLRTPAVSIPVALPWMAGNPYALWAHVRAISPSGAASDWSEAFGFNTSWKTRPAKLPGPELPGLLQWTIVDGASGYDVWFVDAGKVVRMRTNVADEREYYTFHQASPWPDIVRWRVRAVRKAYGTPANRLPTVTYGPWSALQVSLNRGLADGPLQPSTAISDVASVGVDEPAPHRLTPGFSFTGNRALSGKRAELFRVYVFSDPECVNVVFKGAVVGGPGYAPRMSGPLGLPSNTTRLLAARNSFLPDGLEANTYMADGSKVTTTELDKPFVNGDAPPPEPDPAGTPPPSDATAPLPSTPTETGAPVDLWDSGWPNGRYYWTIVGVEVRHVPVLATYLTQPARPGSRSLELKGTTGFFEATRVRLGTGTTEEFVVVDRLTAQTVELRAPLEFEHPVGETFAYVKDELEYRELDSPQDSCEAGRVATFGKVSEPTVTAGGAPFVTGLSPAGRLVQANRSKPSFYGAPLVAWQPALGADQYQLQWSKTKYPWRPFDPVTRQRYEKFTYATSALLDRTVATPAGPGRGPLVSGTWYYRVRGVDFALPGNARAMSWSDPVAIRITKPVFKVSGR
jgi:hypothetical protein